MEATTANLNCVVVNGSSRNPVSIEGGAVKTPCDLAQLFANGNMASLMEFRPVQLQFYLAMQDDAWLDWAKVNSMELDRQGRLQGFKLMDPLLRIQDDAWFSKHFEHGVGKVHVLVVPKTPAKPQWKSTDDSTFALANQSLYFVNRERAVEQLCEAHRSVFIGATTGDRDDAWPIVLADNELGLGKTKFGRQYIQRCREQWPKTVLDFKDFKETLCECHTIVVEIEQGLFTNASEARNVRTILPFALKKAMNIALAQAVIKMLELPDGAKLPDYLTSEEALANRNIVENVVRDLGPVFIVLDEIGQGFRFRKTEDSAMDREEESRELFIEFCSSVLRTWMVVPGVFFVLLCYAPFLRNVGERTDYRQHDYSEHKFIRLGLHLIGPEKIEQIIRKTWVDDSKQKTIQDRWGLFSDGAVTKAALEMYTKTCGNPRTMVHMFRSHESYEDFCKAEVNNFDSGGSDKEWVKINRELRHWKPILVKLLPDILDETPINLSDDFIWPQHAVLTSHRITYASVINRCHLGWEGTITEATVCALPRILDVIVGNVEPLHSYITMIEPLINRVTLAYPSVLEWAFLKRFQELFSEPRRPHTVLPRFFGEKTMFNEWGDIEFPSGHVNLPKITKAKKNRIAPTPQRILAIGHI